MEFSIDIREIFALVKKYAASLCFIILAAFSCSLVYLKLAPESYSASNTFTIQKSAAPSNFYDYDGYYANLALDQKVSALVSWASSASVISEIYQTAKIEQSDYSFTGAKTALGTFTLTISGESQEKVLVLANASALVFKKHIAELSATQTGKLDLTFFTPAVTEKMPNKWLIMVLGIVLGAMLAFIFLCGKIYFSTKVAFAGEARKICGKEEVFNIKINNFSDDEMRKLRFILAGRTNSAVFCPVSLSFNNSAKLVFSFAKNAAHLFNKVAVAEISLRGGKLANLFSARTSPGLADLLENSNENMPLAQTLEPNLSFLPSGNATYDVDLLARSNVAAILRNLLKEFQYIIYFTGALKNAENFKCAELGQPVLLVDLEQTERKDLEQAVSAFKQNRIEFNYILLTS